MKCGVGDRVYFEYDGSGGTHGKGFGTVVKVDRSGSGREHRGELEYTLSEEHMIYGEFTMVLFETEVIRRA